MEVGTPKSFPSQEKLEDKRGLYFKDRAMPLEISPANSEKIADWMADELLTGEENFGDYADAEKLYQNIRNMCLYLFDKMNLEHPDKNFLTIQSTTDGENRGTIILLGQEVLHYTTFEEGGFSIEEKRDVIVSNLEPLIKKLLGSDVSAVDA
jgi:hypothetical protein